MPKPDIKPVPEPKPKKSRCIYCGHPVNTKKDVIVLSTQHPSYGYCEELTRVRCKKCGRIQTEHEMTEMGKRD